MVKLYIFASVLFIWCSTTAYVAAENECSKYLQNHQTHQTTHKARLTEIEGSVIKADTGSKRYLDNLTELPNKSEVEKAIQMLQVETYAKMCALTTQKFNSDDDFKRAVKALETKLKIDILIHLLDADIFYTPCPLNDYKFEEVSVTANVKAVTIRLHVPKNSTPWTASRLNIYQAFDAACQRYFTREMEFYSNEVIPQLLNRSTKKSLFYELQIRFQSILIDLKSAYAVATVDVKTSLAITISENGQKPFSICVNNIQKQFATDLYNTRIQAKFRPVHQIYMEIKPYIIIDDILDYEIDDNSTAMPEYKFSFPNLSAILKIEAVNGLFPSGPNPTLFLKVNGRSTSTTMYQLLHNFVQHKFDKQYDRLVEDQLKTIIDKDKNLLLWRRMSLNRIRVQFKLNDLLENTEKNLGGVKRKNQNSIQAYVNYCLKEFEQMQSKWTSCANFIFYQVEQEFKSPRPEPNINPTESPIGKKLAHYRQIDAVTVFTRVLLNTTIMGEETTQYPLAIHEHGMVGAIASNDFYRSPMKPMIHLVSEQKQTKLPVQFSPNSIVVNINVVGRYTNKLTEIALSNVLLYFLLDPITYVSTQYNFLVNEFLSLMKEKNLTTKEVTVRITELEDIKFKMVRAITTIQVAASAMNERVIRKHLTTTVEYLKALENEYDTLKWDASIPKIFNEVENLYTTVDSKIMRPAKEAELKLESDGSSDPPAV